MAVVKASSVRWNARRFRAALPCRTRGPVSAWIQRSSSGARKCHVGRIAWVRTISPASNATPTSSAVVPGGIRWATAHIAPGTSCDWTAPNQRTTSTADGSTHSPPSSRLARRRAWAIARLVTLRVYGTCRPGPDMLRVAAYDGEVTRRAVTYASRTSASSSCSSAQQPLSRDADGRPEHDELLFIVIHQVYELWFKQLVHELTEVQRTLEAGDTDTTLHLLNRVLKILKTLVAQIDVLETMTPLQFTSFRDRLESASGFQSAQFREIEAILGRRDASAPAAHPEGSTGRARIEAAQGRRSLWGSFLAYLAARGHAPCGRRARARRRPAPGAGQPGPGRPRRRLSGGRRRGPRRRTARRPRRGLPGVAVPPREDGRADDRHEARHGRLGRGGISPARRCSSPSFPTSGRSGAACDRARRPRRARDAAAARGHRRRSRSSTATCRSSRSARWS